MKKIEAEKVVSNASKQIALKEAELPTQGLKRTQMESPADAPLQKRVAYAPYVPIDMNTLLFRLPISNPNPNSSLPLFPST
jgi:hypothetical protein